MDGQTKVVNKAVVQLLRGYCSKHVKTSDEHLVYIQHSNNRAIHTSISKTPFESCFAYLPPSHFDCVFGQQKDKEVWMVMANKNARVIKVLMRCAKK